MKTKDKLIQEIEQEIQTLKDKITKIQQVEFGDLEIEAQHFGEYIDFNELPHEKVIEVIKNIGGKWNKEPATDGTVHYSTEKNGYKIRCYKGQPPPNCKVVEVLETIPAQPERVVTVRKLVCQ